MQKACARRNDGDLSVAAHAFAVGCIKCNNAEKTVLNIKTTKLKAEECKLIILKYNDVNIPRNKTRRIITARCYAERGIATANLLLCYYCQNGF